MWPNFARMHCEEYDHDNPEVEEPEGGLDASDKGSGACKEQDNRGTLMTPRHVNKSYISFIISNVRCIVIYIFVVFLDINN